MNSRKIDILETLNRESSVDFEKTRDAAIKNFILLRVPRSRNESRMGAQSGKSTPCIDRS